MKQVLSDVNYSVSVSQIWFVLYRWLSQRRVTGIPESPSPSWLRPWAARPLLFIVINYLFNTNTVRSSRYGANSACSYCCTYLLTFAGKSYFFCTSTYMKRMNVLSNLILDSSWRGMKGWDYLPLSVIDTALAIATVSCRALTALPASWPWTIRPPM